MGDRVVPVAPARIVGIGGHHMVDLVMAHHPFPKHDKAAQNGGDQDQSDNQLIDC